MNTSSKPLFGIQLSGSSTSTPIFGFEGDGICTYATGGSNTNGTGGGGPVGGAGEPPAGFTGDGYCSAGRQKAGPASPSGSDPLGTDYQGPANTFADVSLDTMTGEVVFGASGLAAGHRPTSASRTRSPTPTCVR